MRLNQQIRVLILIPQHWVITILKDLGTSYETDLILQSLKNDCKKLCLLKDEIRQVFKASNNELKIGAFTKEVITLGSTFIF